MMRWGALAISTAIALAGVAALGAGVVARGRLAPSDFAGRDIVRREAPQAVVHDLVGPGGVEVSLEASTDLCDPPVLAILDVDGDGAADLYHRHCRGHEYVRVDGARLAFVDLGQFDVDDAPSLRGFWGREVFDWRGWRLIGAGGVALLVGIVGVAAFGLARRRDR